MKNILIFGSPRSGTHALSSKISKEQGLINLGEICLTDGKIDPQVDIQRIFDSTNGRKVAHIVQMSSKISLGGMVTNIKEHCEIIVLRRRDKLKQFSSWMYFHKAGGVMIKWHNHKRSDMLIQKREIEASRSDIDQFLLEQMIDDFFQPDQILYYEDIDFSNSNYQKNQYSWELPLIFSNLDFVKEELNNWQYPPGKIL